MLCYRPKLSISLMGLSKVFPALNGKKKKKNISLHDMSIFSSWITVKLIYTKMMKSMATTCLVYCINWINQFHRVLDVFCSFLYIFHH